MEKETELEIQVQSFEFVTSKHEYKGTGEGSSESGEGGGEAGEGSSEGGMNG